MGTGMGMNCMQIVKAGKKVFVLRMYFCIYMFGLCSEKFRAAAIEKKIEKMSYTRIAELKTGSRKEDRKYVWFYYRKCVRLECEKNV